MPLHGVRSLESSRQETNGMDFLGAKEGGACTTHLPERSRAHRTRIPGVNMWYWLHHTTHSQNSLNICFLFKILQNMLWLSCTICNNGEVKIFKKPPGSPCPHPSDSVAPFLPFHLHEEVRFQNWKLSNFFETIIEIPVMPLNYFVCLLIYFIIIHSYYTILLMVYHMKELCSQWKPWWVIASFPIPIFSLAQDKSNSREIRGNLNRKIKCLMVHWPSVRDNFPSILT